MPATARMPPVFAACFRLSGYKLDLGKNLSFLETAYPVHHIIWPPQIGT
jgi:hypothetical protein